MTPNDRESLLEIARARHDAAQAKLQPVIDEERRLRKLLGDLAKDEEVGQLTLEHDMAIRSVRGDEAWLRWVGRNRRLLNMQLASVLARKEAVFREAQATFGRVDILQTLVRDARLKSVRNSQKRAMAQILELHLLRS